MIEVVMLGSGSAVPTVRRHHPCIYLKYKSDNMLFDCGESAQRQIRKAKINVCKISKIFISHWHGDHILGIPGLLQTLMLNNYSRTLEIYGPKGTKMKFERIMSIFTHPGKLKVKVKEVSSGIVVENEDYKVVAEEMSHGTPCLAYSFIEKDKFRLDKKKLKKLKLPHSPLLQKLKRGKDVVIGKVKVKAKSVTYLQKGKKVSIILDTRLNAGIGKIAKDADLLICESTYFDETELARDYKHLTLLQAVSIAKKAKVGKLALMHISQRYEKDSEMFLKTAKKKFKESVIGKDLMRFEI